MIKVIRHWKDDTSPGTLPHRTTSIPPTTTTTTNFFYVFISILPYGEIRDLKEAINMWHELALPVWGHTAH